LITIYTAGASCYRCEQLREWLAASGKTYMTADMTSSTMLAELRTENIFATEAPILRKQSPNQDDWYLAGQLFPDGNLDVELMRKIVGEQA